MPHQNPMSTYYRGVSIVFLILAFSFSAAFAEVKGPSWDEMIKREKFAIDSTHRDIGVYIAQQPERIKKIEEITQHLNQEFMRLSIAFNMFDGNPVEMRNVLHQMMLVRDQGFAVIAPIKEETRNIDNLKKLLGIHLAEYNRLAHDPSIPEINTSAAEHASQIKHTAAVLDTAISILEIVPNGMEQLLARLEPRKAAIEHDLRETWKKYYIVSPSAGFFGVDAWKAARKVFRNWQGFFTYWFIPYTESLRGIVISVVTACIAGMALWVCLIFCILRLRKKYPTSSIPGNFFVCAAYFAFGLPFLITGATTSIGPLSALTFVAEILLAAGLASLGWNLRRLLANEPVMHRHNPLWTYWGIFSLGVILQLFHVPVILFSPLMILVFIVSAIYSFIIRKKNQNLLDKRINLINAWLSLVLCIITFVGWGALAILAATIWFALILNAELVIAFANSLKKLRTAGVPGNLKPAGSLIQGVAFPILFLGLFAVTILWIFLYIGGLPLVYQIIGWRVNIGYISLNIPMIIVVLAILFVTRPVVILVNASISFISNRLSGSGILREGVVKSLHAISAYVIWSLFILVSLKLLGVNVTHLAIVAGGLSIGAGFGLQELIKNSFSGLVLLFGRSIHPGDEIQLENIRGTVIRVNIRNTIMQTNDDSTIFIPNSDLVNKNIVNWTYRDPRGRAEIAVAVAYGSNTERIREILVDCASGHPGVLEEPLPYVLFWDFGENALAFRLRFWIRRPVQTRDKISSAIRFAIEKAFKEENIEMAFPQQDVHIRTADGLKPYFKPD
jgi:potassium-dependent mechanosensitive channel